MANVYVYIFVYGQCFHPKKNLITTKALKCGIDSDKARKNQVYVAKTLPVQKGAGKLKAIKLSVEKINLCHFLQKILSSSWCCRSSLFCRIYCVHDIML